MTAPETTVSLQNDAAFADFLKQQAAAANQSFAVGHLVRLAPFVGTQAQQNLVWRVEAGPDARAKRKAERECYRIVPVSGGRGLLVRPADLQNTTKEERERAARIQPAPEVFAGMVVTATGLRGATPTDRLVILDVRADGTLKLARLGGDHGRYWSKIPANRVRVVEV
jgi:hypothetical protein